MSKAISNNSSHEKNTLRETAAFMAEQTCLGFIHHDNGCREEAIEAFGAVDRLQFQHLTEENAELAATAFVDALWAKDDVELEFLRGGTLDRDGLRDADWGPVARKFRARAAIIGIDPEYAVLKTDAWRNHKTGGDYWTPFQKAQVYELRAAIQDPAYPNKPKYGQSGFGPEALRYVLGVELHDMHTADHWNQAQEVMTPYYARILKEQDIDDE